MTGRPLIRAPELRHATTLLQSTFDRNERAYFELNLNRLCGETTEELRGLYNDTSENISVIDKWNAGELLGLLDPLPGFLHQFNVEHAFEGGRCGDFLTKRIFGFLMDELRTHIKNSRQDPDSGLPLIAFMADDEALSLFGCPPLPEHTRRGHLSGILSHARLNLDELLALAFYTHSHLGLFNIVTRAGRLHRCGYGNFRRAIFPLYRAIAEAVERLSVDPRFGARGMFYKGLNLCANRWARKALWDTLWHDRFCAGHTHYSFGSPMSAGRTLRTSFASRPDYEYLALFSGFRAADVSLFNYGECILPESQTQNAVMTRFLVTETYSHRMGRLADISTVEFVRGD
jgi:hypothetical protein